MQRQVMDVAQSVASCYGRPGVVIRLAPLGRGLINDTFLATQGEQQWVLQKINRDVFPKPEAIIHNHRILCDLKAGWSAGALFELPMLLKTRENADFVRDDDGALWRGTVFIREAQPTKVLASAEQAFDVGRLLGWFHRLVGQGPVNAFIDTLPGFHVTTGYLKEYDRLLGMSPVAGPLSGHISAPLEFVQRRRDRAAILDIARVSGRLRTRVVHGDPKLDNVLFHSGSGKPMALIDLDTVKPGLIQHDFGDCVRSCCNSGGEAGDEDVRFDLALMEQLLSGYVSEAQEILAKEDLIFFPEAIWLLPFELGLRFLSDHLAGNIYFRVTRPGQNLQRALRQFTLVRLIEANEHSIRSMIDRAGTMLA